MADNTVSQLMPFDKGKNLNFIEENGEILFTAEEIGSHLGYGKPAVSVNLLYQRNQKELKHYATCIKLMQVDGKFHETRAFTEEGVYIISMLARTNEAKKFRARVALLLRRLRRERQEAALELARQAGYAQGRDEARSLPAMQAERKAGYLEGMKEGQRLQKRRDGLTALVRIYRYLRKGLSYAETAKLVGLTKNAVAKRVQRARRNGLLAAEPNASAAAQGV